MINVHCCQKFSKDTLVEDVFHDVCTFIKLQERDMFGLAMPTDEGWLFIEPSEFLHKVVNSYLTPMTRITRMGVFFLPTNKSNFHHQPPSPITSSHPTVYFRIRFYVPIYCLNERTTQHLYYKQLRKNHIAYNLFCDPNVYLQLAAFALQAEVGNAPKKYNIETAAPYFLQELYYPSKFTESWDKSDLVYLTYIRHSALRNTVAYLAEFHFIRLATKLNSDFNLHLYPLKKHAEKCRFSVLIGISPNGFTLYQQYPDDWVTPTNRIKWNEIERMYYDHREVTICLRSKSRRRDFKMNRTLSARHLFGLITNMHFYQSIAEMSATHSNGLLEQIEVEGSNEFSV
uniref:FERM domain-containing protein n=1 Tax=Trichobilharzia regenti TaxID=157069 RepID=A0AA85K6H5_TRIRE|nr:unnamed protein product [Trichobilharzia regenti]